MEFFTWLPFLAPVNNCVNEETWKRWLAYSLSLPLPHPRSTNFFYLPAVPIPLFKRVDPYNTDLHDCRIFTTDQVTGLHTLTMTRDRGLEFHTKTGTTLGEKFTQVFTVTEDKPHSPKINIKGNTTFIVTPSTEPPNKEDDLPDPSASCDVRLEYETEMTSDKKYFHLTHHIRALDGKEICFEKSWNKDIERFCV